MTRPQGGGRRPTAAQPPADLPAHVGHGGSTAYHAPYRCRCGLCLEWRRAYDRGRTAAQRERAQAYEDWRYRRRGRSPWYVCMDEDSFTYDWHEYDGARCVRCGANKQTEELWESRWKRASAMDLWIWVFFIVGDPIGDDARPGIAYVQQTASAWEHSRHPAIVEMDCREEFHNRYPGYCVAECGWRQQKVKVWA